MADTVMADAKSSGAHIFGPGDDEASSSTKGERQSKGVTNKIQRRREELLARIIMKSSQRCMTLPEILQKFKALTKTKRSNVSLQLALAQTLASCSRFLKLPPNIGSNEPLWMLSTCPSVYNGNTPIEQEIETFTYPQSIELSSLVERNIERTSSVDTKTEGSSSDKRKPNGNHLVDRKTKRPPGIFRKTKWCSKVDSNADSPTLTEMERNFLPHECLITVAIMQSPERRLTVSEILDYYRTHFKQFNVNLEDWLSGVVRTLLTSNRFVEIPSDTYESLSYWRLDPLHEHMMQKPNIYKRKLGPGGLPPHVEVRVVPDSDSEREIDVDDEPELPPADTSMFLSGLSSNDTSGAEETSDEASLTHTSPEKSHLLRKKRSADQLLPVAEGSVGDASNLPVASGELVKRKRGRPRKVRLPPKPVEESRTVGQSLAPGQKKRGRPRKLLLPPDSENDSGTVDESPPAERKKVGRPRKVCSAVTTLAVTAASTKVDEGNDNVDITHIQRITEAILQSPKRHMTLAQIFTYYMMNFEQFKERDDACRKVIWWTLSNSKCFVMVEREGGARRGFWALDPEYEKLLMSSTIESSLKVDGQPSAQLPRRRGRPPKNLSKTSTLHQKKPPQVPRSTRLAARAESAQAAATGDQTSDLGASTDGSYTECDVPLIKQEAGADLEKEELTANLQIKEEVDFDDTEWEMSDVASDMGENTRPSERFSETEPVVDSNVMIKEEADLGAAESPFDDSDSPNEDCQEDLEAAETPFDDSDSPKEGCQEDLEAAESPFNDSDSPKEDCRELEQG